MVECIILLVVFVLGYELGRRNGWKDGFAQAEAVTPLRLRQDSQEQGQCILCHALPNQLSGELQDETRCSIDI